MEYALSCPVFDACSTHGDLQVRECVFHRAYVDDVMDDVQRSSTSTCRVLHGTASPPLTDASTSSSSAWSSSMLVVWTTSLLFVLSSHLNLLAAAAVFDVVESSSSPRRLPGTSHTAETRHVSGAHDGRWEPYEAAVGGPAGPAATA